MTWDWDDLSGEQIRLFNEALLDAFPTRDDLKRFLRFNLNVDLDEIAVGNRMNTTFELVNWTQARGRSQELYDKALGETNNPRLRKLCGPQQPTAPAGQTQSSGILEVLILSANPVDSVRLQLDKEVREIEIKIRLAELRDLIHVTSKWAVRAEDLLQALNESRPQIVHFSGHGGKSEELLLSGPNGESRPVSKQALESLFKTLKDRIRVVLFNACYSEPQAEAITRHIDCAIGMSKAIGDEAAIVFAASFYSAIGFGRSVGEAFEQGRTALLLQGIPEEQTPQLRSRDGVDANDVYLLARH